LAYIALPGKTAYLTKKIKQHIATANDNFFSNETHLVWIVQ